MEAFKELYFRKIESIKATAVCVTFFVKNKGFIGVFRI